MILEIARRLRENIHKVIVGKDEVIDLVLAAVLCEGHILFEDVPGIGKTTLARALAISLGCTFQRIQFTPDLLPPPDAVGASGGDAGAAGHGRWGPPAAAAPVPRAGYPESRRAGGHLPPAGGADRSLSGAGADRLSQRSRGRGDSAPVWGGESDREPPGDPPPGG